MLPILSVILMLTSPFSNTGNAQTPVFTASVTSINQSPGATTLDELGSRLHAALSNSSLSSLTPFLIDKQAYDKLLKQSSPQLRETPLLLTPDNIMADFQREFNTVVRDGVTSEINWAQTNLGGISKQETKTTTHGLIPTVLRLSDQNNSQIEVNFEAVQIDDRYYFFQQVRLGEEAQRF